MNSQHASIENINGSFRGSFGITSNSSLTLITANCIFFLQKTPKYLLIALKGGHLLYQLLYIMINFLS